MQSRDGRNSSPPTRPYLPLGVITLVAMLVLVGAPAEGNHVDARGSRAGLVAFLGQSQTRGENDIDRLLTVIELTLGVAALGAGGNALRNRNKKRQQEDEIRREIRKALVRFIALYHLASREKRTGQPLGQDRWEKLEAARAEVIGAAAPLPGWSTRAAGILDDSMEALESGGDEGHLLGSVRKMLQELYESSWKSLRGSSGPPDR